MVLNILLDFFSFGDLLELSVFNDLSLIMSFGTTVLSFDIADECPLVLGRLEADYYVANAIASLSA